MDCQEYGIRKKQVLILILFAQYTQYSQNIDDCSQMWPLDRNHKLMFHFPYVEI